MPKDIGTDPQHEPPSDKRALEGRQSRFLSVLEKNGRKRRKWDTPRVVDNDSTAIAKRLPSTVSQRTKSLGCEPFRFATSKRDRAIAIAVQAKKNQLRTLNELLTNSNVSTSRPLYSPICALPRKVILATCLGASATMAAPKGDHQLAKATGAYQLNSVNGASDYPIHNCNS